MLTRAAIKNLDLAFNEFGGGAFGIESCDDAGVGRCCHVEVPSQGVESRNGAFGECVDQDNILCVAADIFHDAGEGLLGVGGDGLGSGGAGGAHPCQR